MTEIFCLILYSCTGIEGVVVNSMRKVYSFMRDSGQNSLPVNISSFVIRIISNFLNGFKVYYCYSESF
jgi:hypothetical protein